MLMNKMSGIYRIVCVKTGRYYYGSSNNITKRWWTHRTSLNKNLHDNIVLQRAWNKYGESSFKIEMIELVEPSLLLEVEQGYLDIHVGKRNCMNISKDASAPMRGRIHTDDTKLHWSEIRKGKGVGVDNPFYGKKHSDETKQHLSEVRTGRSPSQETRNKISESLKQRHISS